MLLVWSACTTPATLPPAAIGTSNGHPSRVLARSRHAPSDDLPPHRRSEVDRIRPVLRLAMRQQVREVQPLAPDHQMVAFGQHLDLRTFLQADLLEHRSRQPNTDAVAPFL